MNHLGLQDTEDNVIFVTCLKELTDLPTKKAVYFSVFTGSCKETRNKRAHICMEKQLYITEISRWDECINWYAFIIRYVYLYYSCIAIGDNSITFHKQCYIQRLIAWYHSQS